MRFATKPAPAVGGAKPRLLSILPPIGSTVANLNLVELTFDQPMMPPEEAFPYRSEERAPPAIDYPQIAPPISYDAQAHKFSFALLSSSFRSNQVTLLGFRNASGVPADPVKLSYKVTDQLYSQEYLAQAEQWALDPALVSLLERISRARQQVHSLSEVVECKSIGRNHGLSDRLLVNAGCFKWEAGGKFFADIGGLMLGHLFRIGGDGRNCWCHTDSRDGPECLLVGQFDELKKTVTVCDPFTQTGTRPQALLLRYIGVKNLDQQACHVVRAWWLDRWIPSDEELKLCMRANYLPAQQGHCIEWWIDAESYRPVEVRQFLGEGGGSELHYRFYYEHVNQPFPESEFAPPVIADLKQRPLDPLGTNFTDHVLMCLDGSSGFLKVGWGQVNRANPKNAWMGGFADPGF